MAHLSLRAGGLPVGAALVDANGVLVADGRNRSYDPPGGDDPLQRTPIAHAELNVLARVDTDTELDGLTLWSTHRPCAMCAAACSFVGLESVRFVAPDPSDADHSDPADADQVSIVVANLMFLAGIHAFSGAAAPMLERARAHEPEVMDLVDSLDLALLRLPSLDQAVDAARDRIQRAAQRRGSRVA